MMGAGFGGCTINLVEKDALESFREKSGIDTAQKAAKRQKYGMFVSNVEHPASISHLRKDFFWD